MEILQKIFDFAGNAVTLVGLAFAVWGLITLGEAQAQDNGADKSKGMRLIMGGAIIVGTGLIIVPMLAGQINFA